jgi:uncharacterized protein YbaR (Trm112 family)
MRERLRSFWVRLSDIQTIGWLWQIVPPIVTLLWSLGSELPGVVTFALTWGALNTGIYGFDAYQRAALRRRRRRGIRYAGVLWRIERGEVLGPYCPNDRTPLVTDESGLRRDLLEWSVPGTPGHALVCTTCNATYDLGNKGGTVLAVCQVRARFAQQRGLRTRDDND